MSARDRFIEVLRSRGMLRPGEEWVIDSNLDAFAHELAEEQRAYAEEEWSGSDARMILRRRVARHLADLIDPPARDAGPVRPDEEPTP